MQKPLVSIIVPIYNVAPYLSECLQSLTEQSYGALDIILIDDGSDDESLKIALDFAVRDGRIFVVSKPNGGQASARNFGLEFVRGTGLREFFERGVNFGSNNTNLQENLQNAAIPSLRGTQCRSNPQKKGASATMDCFAPNGSRNDDLEANSANFSSNSAQNSQNSTAHNDDSAAQIQSLAQTHTFEKTYKSISGKEIQAHFTQVAPNFIKSDLVKIGDFITQELPPNALIHFVDSDDYLTKDCIEKCVKALCEQGLELAAHNLTHFYEKSGEFKEDDFLGKMRQNAYESGLELLSENKFTSLYFSWQGLFKAELLNRYALRFCEGIYHEDHDFGTLLFALAGKVAYTSEPLYIYRERPNSTMTSYQSTAMPAKMPYFLEPLRTHFSDYKALRAYFKAYCFIKIAHIIREFYEANGAKNPKFKRKYRVFFRQVVREYEPEKLVIIHLASKPTPLQGKAKFYLKSMGYTRLAILFVRVCYYARAFYRHPFSFKESLSKKRLEYTFES